MLCVYIRNCASYAGGDDIFRKIMKQNGRKVKNGAERLQMASVMGICGGLVGPKSENVEKALVLLLFFEGSRGAKVRQPDEQNGEPRR